MINKVPDRFTCLLIDIRNIYMSGLHIYLKTTPTPMSGQDLSKTFAAVAGLSYYNNNNYYHVIIINDKLAGSTISLHEVLFYFNNAKDDTILHHFTSTNKILFPNALEASFSAFEKVIKPSADTCTCITSIIPSSD
jgi:hypothetical protein